MTRGGIDRPMQWKSKIRLWHRACMVRSLAALTVLGASLCIEGCMDSPLPTDEASLSATFHLDGSTNNEGVEVVLPGTAYRGYSDSDGHIIFDNLPARTYELLARKEGYQDFRERKITLEPGDHIDLGIVHLAAIPRDGTLEGEVAVEDLAAASVTISLFGTSISSIVSATDGFFRLADIPAGLHQVLFGYPDEPPRLQIPVTIEAGKTVRLPRLLPGLRQASTHPHPLPTDVIDDVTDEPALPTPSPTALPAPPTVQPEPTVDPNAPGIVKGYAFYPDRQDHSGILVRIVDPPLQATTDAAGLYLISSVPPGLRTLRAEAEGYEPLELVDLTVPAGQLTQAPRIQLPVPGASQASGAVSRVYGQVILADKGEQPGIPVSLEGTNFTAISGRDGTFVFNSVPSGIYVAIASLEGYEPATYEIEVPDDGEDVPIPVITLQPVAIYMTVLETNPRQNARKVPVTDRVHVEIRLSERFIPSALKGAVTVFPQVAARIETPDSDLITVDLLRTERPEVQFETSYTITVGTSLVSTEGHRLERPYVLLFKTGGPRILGSRPEAGSKGVILAPDEPIWLDLNQPINLRSLQEKIRITPNSGEVPVLRQERTAFGQKVEIQIQVSPKRKFRITIPSSIRTLDGQKYENTPYRIEFQTGDYDELPDRNDEYLNEINDMLDY